MKTLITALGLLALSASAAFAHATLEVDQAPQGTYKGVLRVPHGCDGQPTLKVRIQIPEGVIAVKPMPKAGWTLEVVKGPYEKEYDYFGSKLKEGVKEIVWTGELSDQHYDEFTFRGRISEAFAVGTAIWFPTVQECANGAERWIEIPAAGQDPHDLKSPAPGVTVIEAPHKH